MFNFGTTYEPPLDPNYINIETTYEQVMVSEDKYIKTGINKTNKNKLDQPKNENEVIDFFSKKNWSTLEAKKFYNHYQGIGWKVGGKTKIVDWQATAKNWMIKAEEIKKEKTRNVPDQKLDNFNVKTDKNYGEPL